MTEHGGAMFTQSECMKCGALGPRAKLGNDEPDYGDKKAIEAWNMRAALLAEDSKELADALRSRDFYKRRCDLLQQWQDKMRDPERTIVCDILANGQTLPDPNGTRYGLAEDKEGGEVVAKVMQHEHGGVTVNNLIDTDLPCGTRLYARPQPQAEVVRVPLTDEEISELYEQVEPFCTPYQFKLITRAIESSHGITAQNHKD